jgi:hypothetical protein
VATAERALARARRAQRADLQARFAERLDLYRAHRPFRMAMPGS